MCQGSSTNHGWYGSMKSMEEGGKNREWRPDFTCPISVGPLLTLITGRSQDSKEIKEALPGGIRGFCSFICRTEDTMERGEKMGDGLTMRGSKCACACMLVCVRRLKAFQVILTLGGLWKTLSIINHQSSITREVRKRGSDSLERNKRNGSMRTLSSKCF